jgi:tetratricopeptide (TPR) repeat protein
MRMHIWTGKLNEVREHAERALRIARACGDTNTEFWSEWAMGAMEGLIGHTEEMARRVERARELATSIGSPLLRLEITELEVELLYARGEWDEALAVGGPAIELARSLDARTILPRLLVWGSQIHLGRGDLEIVDQLTREAWDASGADAALGAPGFLDVHTVVPAHIGRAAYHLARGDWGDAARIAEAGLAIADRTGYVVWAIHHVLPIIGEASIHARDLLRAREIGIRMRREAEALGHPLGLAWADTCDAVLTWLEGDPRQGALALRKAAEALGAIPLVYESNRVRRQLAGRLAELGDRDGALAELRRVHAVFARLGARAELAKTVEQFGQLGAEPSV